ncbi:membrane protein US18 [Cercopithecine betaherpesvirus 5]|uniref:Membrane protein US18 n=1 Tax=Simian cytomegalovirus (strain Colburn) TaxID=50292 RepID=G8XTM4_SCMVC|nr:membrane protein US18 [Cercopithecine betaherpesvirus 5]AEV80516.1 membrane protein US18 [Cercopithecine betaherpesvirus 5]
MSGHSFTEMELSESWMHENLLNWIHRFRCIVSIYSNILFELAGTFSTCVLLWFSFPNVTEMCLLCTVPTGAILIPTLCLGIACCCQKEMLRYAGSSTFACVLIDTSITVMTGFCCPRKNLSIGIALTLLMIVMCNTLAFYAGRNAVRWRMFLSGCGWAVLCFFFFLVFAKAAIIYKIFTVMYFCLITGVSYLMVYQLLYIIHPTSSETPFTWAMELTRSMAVYAAIITMFNAFSMMFSMNEWMGVMIGKMNQTEHSSWGWLLLNKP